jgi:hypothetical protein
LDRSSKSFLCLDGFVDKISVGMTFLIDKEKERSEKCKIKGNDRMDVKCKNKRRKIGRDEVRKGKWDGIGI